MYHNNKKKRMARGGTVNYGIGGALMNIVGNKMQGKKLGDGLFKGTLKSMTPWGSVGAAGNLAKGLGQKFDKPGLEKIGGAVQQGADFVGGANAKIGGAILGKMGVPGGQQMGDAVAGLYGGGGGGGGLFGGGGGNPAGGWGQVPGGGGGGGLLNMASQFLGEQGMAVPNKNENVKTIKHSMAAGGYSYPAMRGVKLMKGGAVYADNGVMTPEGEPPLEDLKLEYIMKGGSRPGEEQGYFLLGGQYPMDMAQVREYLRSEHGLSEKDAAEETRRMRSAGSSYTLPSIVSSHPQDSPFKTRESGKKATDLMNEARIQRELGNEKKAEEIEALIPGLLGNPGVDFRKTLSGGEMVKDPTVSPFLSALERMKG